MKFLYRVNVRTQKSTKFLSLLHIHKILYDIIKHNKIYILFMLFIRACLYVCVYTHRKKFISSPVDSNDPDLSIQLLLLLVLKFIQINLFRPSGEGERKFPFSLYFIFSFSLLLIVNSNLLFVQQFVLCNYSHSVIL